MHNNTFCVIIDIMLNRLSSSPLYFLFIVIDKYWSKNVRIVKILCLGVNVAEAEKEEF